MGTDSTDGESMAKARNIQEVIWQDLMMDQMQVKEKQSKMIPTCRAGVTERMTGPHAEQENIRDYRGKYVAFYFRHVEFDCHLGGENN